MRPTRVANDSGEGPSALSVSGLVEEEARMINDDRVYGTHANEIHPFFKASF